jgi:hypothetical protein
MSSGNWSGLYIGDRTSGKVVGEMSPNGDFSVRVARGLFSNYSGYTWLRGSIRPRDVRTVVVGRFRPHPLMQLGTGIALFLFVLLATVLVLASIRQPAFLGFLPMLLIVPMLLFLAGRSVRRDRAVLRGHIEAVLQRFGPVQSERGT